MWVEKNGKTYRIRDLAGGDKITVKSGFATKTAANNYMTHMKSDKLSGKSLVHRGGEIELDEWIDLWWPSYETSLKPSSRISAQGLLHRHIRPMLGGYDLDDITRLVVARWVADLTEGRTLVRSPRPLARKTVANAHGLLHRILGGAVADRMIPENPCNRTNLGQKQHHEMMFLTEQQAEQVVRQMLPYWQPLVLFLLGSGCRWAEAIGLRVRDVDLLERRIYVRRALQELRDHAGFVEVEPKSGAGRRTFKITVDLALTLTPLIGDKGPDERVFLAPKGGQVRYRPFWARWDEARKAADVPECRIHDLRHTHASWLIAANVSGGLTAIQRRLGHSSIRVTSDLYGHLMPETDDSIVDALDLRMPKIQSRGDIGESAGRDRATEGIPGQPRAGQGASVGRD